MRNLRPSDTLRSCARLQLIELEPGRLLARSVRGTAVLRGVTRAEVEALVDAVGPGKPLSSLVAELGDRAAGLRSLVGVVFEVQAARSGVDRQAGEVVLLGNGRLATALREQLGGDPPIKLVAVGDGGMRADELGGQRLADLLRGARRAVVALEDIGYRMLGAVGDAAVAAEVPCTFVTVTGHQIEVGPTVVESNRRCLEYNRAPGGTAAFDQLEAHAVGDATPAGALFRAGQVLAGDLRLAVSELCWKVVECSAGSARERVLAGGEAFELLAGSRVDGARVDAAATLEPQVSASLPRVTNLSVPAMSRRIKRIGVLGGGTAGYFAAIGLKRHFPAMEVTVIESSKIPIIGVGEATTPATPRFLHGVGGVDPKDIYKMGASWKLGIRFDWGLPEPYHFNFPFGAGDLLSSSVHDGTTVTQNLNSLIMEVNTSPLMKLPDGRYYSLLPRMMYAYHLDNQPFVHFLNRHALASGVNHLDRVIADAELTDDGQNIACLIDSEGQRYEFDLYVDCSGFRSFLLEQKLGARFISYASTLFNDTAITANLPHGGKVKTYTRAQTMDNGWCWTIPMLEEDHLGYVFSSAFSDPDAAYEEMARKHPGLSERRGVVKFRCGRHENFWVGNVVAIGNAYGFVEPLESTAIHMVIVEVKELMHWLSQGDDAPSVRAACNHAVASHWDFLRGFLGIHFKFNRRLDTPYWRACRADADISIMQPNVDLFRKASPLGAHNYKTMPLPDPFQANPFGIDNLLLGQKVESAMPQPAMSGPAWAYRSGLQKELASRCIPSADAIRILGSDAADDVVYDSRDGRRW